jgi:rhamnosyltransferase
MQHAFGSSSLSVPWGNGRHVPERDPSRSYYIYRNALLLLFSAHCPGIWKLNEVRRLVLLMGLYLVRSPRRWRHLRMAFRGVVDALRGRTGPMPVNPAAVA